MFSEYEIIREASPQWLNKQRFDIFIQNLILQLSIKVINILKQLNYLEGKKD
jgi:hypothetical protein